MGDKLPFLYERLNIFLSFDYCDFSPSLCVKGTFLYQEFINFLKPNITDKKLNVKLFYDLMETWMIGQKDPSKQVKRYTLSRAVYFRNVCVKGKVDNSKEKYNQRMREGKQRKRYEKAEKQGRVIIPRKTLTKPNQLYVTKLPNDVFEWDQHRITIENFSNWYNSEEIKESIKTIANKSYEELEELELTFKQALNDFRHAKEIRPREFNNNHFKYIFRHMEDVLDSVGDKLDKSEE